MKQRVLSVMVVIVMLVAIQQQARAQAKTKKSKQPDTTGMAAIESSIEDLKTIVAAETESITNGDNLESIKRAAGIMEQLDDTLTNHIFDIFVGFNNAHPLQYTPMKNISDISNRIMQCKNIERAKKYNQNIITEYNSLLKAN